MNIATMGAFAIGEYPEGVAVMLFYTVGELFQDAAMNRAKRSIRVLLEIRLLKSPWCAADKAWYSTRKKSR
jgi:Cd2+/Zn2+-exporting ATPase